MSRGQKQSKEAAKQSCHVFCPRLRDKKDWGHKSWHRILVFHPEGTTGRGDNGPTKGANGPTKAKKNNKYIYNKTNRNKRYEIKAITYLGFGINLEKFLGVCQAGIRRKVYFVYTRR